MSERGFNLEVDMIIIATPDDKYHDSVLLSRSGDDRVFAAVDIDFFFTPEEHRERDGIVSRLHKGKTITFELKEVG